MSLRSFLFMIFVSSLAFYETIAQADEQDPYVPDLDLLSAEEDIQATNISLRAAFVCQEEGKFCDGCTKVVTCSEAEEGIFTTGVETCTGTNNYCLVTSAPDATAFEAACTVTTFHPMCNAVANSRFPCTAVGTFPHPFYCDRFIVCRTVSGSGTSYNCPTGFAYDVLTGRCNVPKAQIITKGTVTTATTPGEPGCNAMNNVFPVPLCRTSTQIGPIVNYDGTSSVLYYQCTLTNNRLYPVIRVCPYGQNYDGDASACIVPEPL